MDVVPTSVFFIVFISVNCIEGNQMIYNEIIYNIYVILGSQIP